MSRPFCTAWKCSRHGPSRLSRIIGASLANSEQVGTLQSSILKGFKSYLRRQSPHSSSRYFAKYSRSRCLYPGLQAWQPTELISIISPDAPMLEINSVG